MTRRQYYPPEHINSEGRNWARYCLTDGSSPIPPLWREAGWVRFVKKDETDRDEEQGAPPPPPVDRRSAQRIQRVYDSLQQVSKHVMCSFWVGNYIFGRPRGDHETVRLLNQLVQMGRLDVPPGFQFSLHQYVGDMKTIIVPRMESALAIRA